VDLARLETNWLPKLEKVFCAFGDHDCDEHFQALD
jgi:hypothetical protein